MHSRQVELILRAENLELLWGDLNNIDTTSLGEIGEFQVYDEIWEAAKNAASSAGYEKFLAFAGEDNT